MEAKRLTDLSYLRTIAIFAIVLLHSFSPYMGWTFVVSPYEQIYHSIFHVWLAARMPLFLFISGFLFSYLLHVKNKYSSVGGFVVNKAKRLLLPYVVFAVLMLWTQSKLSWVYFLNGYWHLWFLLTLFLCFVATRMLKFIDSPLLHILLFIGFACLSLYVKTKIRLGVNYFVFYYVYFYFGYIIARYRAQLSILFEKRFVIFFFILWLVLNIVITYNGINGYLRLGANFSFILFVYGLLQQLLQKGLIKENPFIEKINKYSYGIYVFHAWLIVLLFLKGKFYSDWVYRNATDYSILFPILLFVLVFSASMGITHLTLKTKFGRFLIG